MSDESVGVDIRFESDGATATEIAAVTAVITGIVAELAAAESVHAYTPPTAWQHNQRPMRTPINPGPGVWRSFG
jgi:hypothetical protein